MPNTPQTGANANPVQEDVAGYLDIPSDRRSLAKAHVAMLSATADRVARTLPIGADVDDFRRVMAEGAKP